jgi:CxxC motif-containing protein (DUF1111 family)
MRTLIAVVCSFSLGGVLLQAQSDPGPRPRPNTVPAAIRGVTTYELSAFMSGLATFNEVEDVADGLGPRFNLDSCGGCHAQPSAGGSSPALNPQIRVATASGAQNRIPPFLQPNGPVRVVRFKRAADGTADGGVHDLFTISGRGDASPACKLQQPDFSNVNNLTFRIPTPTFGLGLVEAVPDSALRANLAADGQRKRSMGIQGRFNTNGNDGTITRFGWKAQNKSLMIFSGEAYNVEMGVTNELFPQSRDEDPTCASTSLPEDHSHLDTGTYSDADMFSIFMRYLAPPRPSDSNPSIDRGRNIFDSVGCTLCHTPVLRTGLAQSAALSNQDVHLYSDLAIHVMGQGLDDGISQGQATGQEFRTAPLWGLGDRLFFLHDGRSRDLMETIRLHDSPGSEAHQVIMNFGQLQPPQKQDLLNFLRSL